MEELQPKQPDRTVPSTPVSQDVAPPEKVPSPVRFQDKPVQVSQGTPLFKDRSPAETEAAHDLLELSRSLPPLPPPSVAIGPHNIIETPATDVQVGIHFFFIPNFFSN